MWVDRPLRWTDRLVLTTILLSRAQNYDTNGWHRNQCKTMNTLVETDNCQYHMSKENKLLLLLLFIFNLLKITALDLNLI